MKKGAGICIYLAVGLAGILANFILWRYRLHLYDLDTDYRCETLQHIQMILFRGTEAFILVGALLLSLRKIFRNG